MVSDFFAPFRLIALVLSLIAGPAFSQVLSSPFVLAVSASFPAKTVKELVSFAKAKPGEVAYGSAGVGSGPHLAAVLFANMTGTSLNHVPYKSGGAVMPDLIAGRVQLLFAPRLP